MYKKHSELRIVELPERLRNSSFFLKLALLIPYSPSRGAIWHFLDKNSHTILDAGCGKGRMGQSINLHNKCLLTMGIDAFRPYIKYCTRKRFYDNCIVADIRYLPFKKKSFDAILCIDVIEHVSKKDSLKLIRDLEEVARKQIVISCPVGYYQRQELEKFANEDRHIFQIHKSIWFPHEFKKLGYRVRGQYPAFLPLAYFLSFILPLIILVFYVPDLADNMVCIKNLTT